MSDEFTANHGRPSSPRDHKERLDELLAANSRMEQENRDQRAEIARLKTALHHVSHAGLDVLAERAAQVSQRGYRPEADDRYVKRDLAKAAAAYALAAVDGGLNNSRAKEVYPWKGDPFSRDQRFNLVRAGALIIAELDRLNRARDVRPSPVTEPPPASPVVDPYSQCTYDLREAGKPYPRTCQICGLGKCRKHDEASKRIVE